MSGRSVLGRGSIIFPMRKPLLALPLLFFLQLGCSNSYVFNSMIQQFTACPNNPALTLGVAGTFDGGSVRDNVVWYGRGRIWTLYTAAASGVPPYDPTIGIASSTDGCTWAKGGQVIVPNSAVNECAGGVFSPSVYYDTASDSLTVAVSCVSAPSQWYTGPSTVAELQVTSGADWNAPASYRWQNGGKPVLTESQPWEGTQGVYAPSIASSGKNFYMYYSSSSSSAGRYQVGIAVAGSPLGPWTKSPQNPITPRDTRCEEPATIPLASGTVYLFCDSVGADRHGVNVFSLEGADPMQAANWFYRGVYELPGAPSWRSGEIGSQSVIGLPDGRVLMTYNGKPAGTQSDVRKIGFAFLQFKSKQN